MCEVYSVPTSAAVSERDVKLPSWETDHAFPHFNNAITEQFIPTISSFNNIKIGYLDIWVQPYWKNRQIGFWLRGKWAELCWNFAASVRALTVCLPWRPALEGSDQSVEWPLPTPHLHHIVPSHGVRQVLRCLTGLSVFQEAFRSKKTEESLK